MGNSQTSSADPRLSSATRAFSHHELELLQHLFNSLASQSRTSTNDAHFVSPSIFKGHFGIPGCLGDRMFDLITQKRHDQKLTFEDLVIAKGTYEKGTKDEIQEFVFQLLDVNDDGRVTRSDVQAVLAAIFDDAFPSKDGESGLSSDKYIIDDILNAIQFSENGGESDDEGSMSFGDFKNLCLHIPSIRKYLRGLLAPSDPGSICLLYSTSPSFSLIFHLTDSQVFEGGGMLATHDSVVSWGGGGVLVVMSGLVVAARGSHGVVWLDWYGESGDGWMRVVVQWSVGEGFQVPRLLYPESYGSNILLKVEYAWLLGGLLTQPELEEWKLLYHSSFHGQSFNTFLGNVSNDEGPTLLIIKDKEGYLYGGYASQPWEKHSDFYGDMKCFLFQLHPKVYMYRPTGANTNLQWCAVNYCSESIPNGIGLGGRVNHFGLFVSASFDTGQTFECTTFGSPCLSKSNRICPEVIECWSVFPKEVQQQSNTALKGTVLQRFEEDRNMLNLVGLANSSQ
ncbi:hypothetical protein KSS87_015164 [Heliosperma pusillum]|nr:hypothetical protein KSS87_015164 [Heliosperma pusillum]